MLAHDQPLVFCDVETTGTTAVTGRITEIACIRYEHGKEVDRLVTLIHPDEAIPYSISMITGITDEMVSDAPHFEDIAPRVAEIFDGAILVAHNARFDYSFIRAEMQRAGYSWNPPQWCTVKISRTLFPHYRRHDLSSIIDRHGFHCSDRHRALGDTEVLVQFAQYIHAHVPIESIQKALVSARAVVHLPPQLKKQTYDSLPHSPGVYLFYNRDDELLYVGKSVDIKKRVQSHFSNALRDPKSKRIWEELHTIDYKETASNLGAELLELHVIKSTSPLFNRKSRRTQSLWYLEKHMNAQGYTACTLKKTSDLGTLHFKHIYAVYRTKHQAKESLEALARKNMLCPQLLGIHHGSGACFSYQLGMCSGACAGAISADIYNMKMEMIFGHLRLRAWPFPGKKVITRQNARLNRAERFVINNWILESAHIWREGDDVPSDLFENHSPVFDYDMYKVLAKQLR